MTEIEFIISLIIVAIISTAFLIWVDYTWRKKYEALQDTFNLWRKNNLNDKVQRYDPPKSNVMEIPLLYIGIEPKNGDLSSQEMNDICDLLNELEQEKGHIFRYMDAEDIVVNK